MADGQIRVLLVDDSPLALALISRGLAKTADIVVVGTARDGFEALEVLPKVKPDVVCTDFFMPRMNGLELTHRIMTSHPLPIIVISGMLNVKTSQEVFSLIEAGALDCIEKPSGVGDNSKMEDLIAKIRILSKVFLIKGRKNTSSTVKLLQDSVRAGMHRLLIIGASTGGPNVLMEIISKLPANFPAPVVCIQHISHGFLDAFADWIQGRCKMKVEILTSDKLLKDGVIYLPQEDKHFEMKTPALGGVSNGPSFHGHRPSVTVGMESVAKWIGREAVGVLLTGMGDDGALGMKAIHDKGGLTIAQNEESCVVFGMPKEAIDKGGANLILDPAAITELLLRIFTHSRKLN